MAVLHLNETDFDATIAQGVTLVDFWATWCGPCRMLAPVIEKLAEQYDGRAKVAKVDIDENPGLANRFGIMSIPTVLVFQDGTAVSQAVGVQAESVYRKFLDEALMA